MPSISAAVPTSLIISGAGSAISTPSSRFAINACGS